MIIGRWQTMVLPGKRRVPAFKKPNTSCSDNPENGVIQHFKTPDNLR